MEVVHSDLIASSDRPYLRLTAFQITLSKTEGEGGDGV
uniref:Uncharacterized protein n=1 Tax=Nelumbo nucifera TaxID=4432 RepID=A0A822XWX1_NELNU|nr:TPA_asm: hypothetical protein HUJ06_024728 [Nelumbo nucifera]